MKAARMDDSARTDVSRRNGILKFHASMELGNEKKHGSNGHTVYMLEVEVGVVAFRAY